MTDKPEVMSGESLNIAAQRRDELKQLFPGVFTETKDADGNVVSSIDFERLKAELGTFSDIYEGRRERYGMEWPGKRDCMKVIQEPSRATLKPCPDESVDWDTTKNLFIEGDNLEVLKLLQKSYYGKVKMIYIDPPYNTGNEFIYPDNYQETLDTYLTYAGLLDDEGKKFTTNTASEGRYHTKWLNMMYPRLFLAKNLLREDGVVFVSIDYRESSNLRNLLNEIFGEENLIFDVSVVNNLKGRNDREGIATCHENLLIYCKHEYNPIGLPLSDDKKSEYNQIDENTGAPFQWRDLRKRGGADTRKERPKMYYPLYVNSISGEVSMDCTDEFDVAVYPVKSDGTDGRWRWGKEKTAENISKLLGKKVSNRDKWNISYKVFMSEEGTERRVTPKSIWLDPKYSTDSATKALASLFPKLDAKKFTPKPIGFLSDIIEQSTERGDIVLDFFCGTGSTGIALMENNIQNGIDRQFILVQLPEPISESLPDEYNSILTIADLAKERLRRFAKEKNSTGLPERDLGFKVFRLDKSNFKEWEGKREFSVDILQQQLTLSVDSTQTGASHEGILYEILLKAGFELTESIKKLVMCGKCVFSVAHDALLICLEDQLTTELIDEVISLEPMQFICLDKGFQGNDQLKANTAQAFKARSQDSEAEMVFKVV